MRYSVEFLYFQHLLTLEHDPIYFFLFGPIWIFAGSLSSLSSYLSMTFFSNSLAHFSWVSLHSSINRL